MMSDLYITFFVKHFICDFPLQATPYMYRNKGTYGHPGGILHASIHGIGTLSILGPLAAIIDALVHYHIDWAKMRLGAHYNLKPDNSEMFWILLGVDQLFHYLTYAGLIIWFA